MAKYPKFCDESSGINVEAALENSCKVELATILAHILQSSDGLQKVEDECANSLGNDCVYDDDNNQDRYEKVEGQYYYGRGALMMKTVEFYGQLSEIAFDGALDDKDILLENPDLVATDGRLAFLSAFMIYMRPQHSTPSMHDAILGFYAPNQRDIQENMCTKCFGTTTNILNGEKECRHWITTNTSAVRGQNFLSMCDKLSA